MIPFLQSHSGLTSRVSSIFANNEPGVWYDPSDLSTLYQDAAGTTPVTAVEQPVGLMLDKSRGLALGPELVTGVVTGYINSDQTTEPLQPPMGGELTTEWFPVVGGKTYRLASVGGTSSRCRIQVKNASNVISYLSAYSGNRAADAVAVPLADSVQMRVYFRTVADTATGLSVRELPGNHARQTTATSRPVLSARVNLLTYSQEFDVHWAKFSVTMAADAVVAPDGTLTADRMIETSSTNQHRLDLTLSSAALSVGATYTFSVHVKSGGRNFAALRVNTDLGALFNISTGQLVALSGGALVVDSSAAALANGWTRLSISWVATNTFAILRLLASPNENTSNVFGGGYQGDGTSGIYIWGADLRVANDGVNLPPYQRVNTATDYDTTGFPMYLRCDGVDDGMVTNSINFTGTDKVTVCAGVRKLSNAVGAIVELSPDMNSYNGVSALFWDSSGWWRYSSKGTVRSNADIPAASGAVTGVLSGFGDISGDRATLRVNGTQAAQSTDDQGAGTYGNYPLYLFRRGGTTLPFNGRFYGMVIVGRLLSAGELQRTEKYINGLTKAY